MGPKCSACLKKGPWAPIRIQRIPSAHFPPERPVQRIQIVEDSATIVKSNPKYREIPLIIVSTEGSDRDKGLDLAADAYRVKPFEPEMLRQLARDLLARTRQAV
jgi:hypothetical protein